MADKPVGGTAPISGGDITNSESAASMRDLLRMLDATQRAANVSLETFKTTYGEVVLNMKKVNELQKDYMDKWMQSHDTQRKLLEDGKIDELRKDKEYIKAYESIKKKSVKIAALYEQNLYKEASFSRKKQLTDERIAEVNATKRRLAEEEAEELAKAGRSQKKIDAIKRRYLKQYLSLEAEADKQMARKKSLSKVESATFGKTLSDQIRLRSSSMSSNAEELRRRAEETQRSAMMEEDDEKRKEMTARAKTEAKAAIRAENQAKILAGLASAVEDIKKKMNTAVDDAMKNISTYMPVLDSRLQGSGKSYETISDMLKNNLTTSPYVSQVKVLENISEAVKQGVAYNVEQRAFLNTLSDRMASTFDAFDKNLTRLIRLQQADTTAARLGLEASMTQFLNQRFSDTSYLSDVYDTVSSALVDANSQMTRNESVAFEYTVQKWLGSLYSLGMSDSFISKVAEGINYLGTGNVEALAGNENLQTLMAMSASRAGLPYADLLTGGMNANTTNKLLESMVGYLKEIAETSENQVVKSAYGNIFGLSMSDMRALTNLTGSDIRSISGTSLSYKGAMKSFNEQLGLVASRTSISSMIENLFNNAIYSLGSNIAENPASYVLWKVANMITEATGGIHIPAVSVLGNMVDLSSFTVEGIMKSGIVGASSLSLIGQIINSLGSRGGLDMSAWGASEFTSRGTGFTGAKSGVSSGISSSTYIGNASSSDTYESSLSSASEEAERTSKITNKNAKTEYEFDDLYKSLFVDKLPMRVEMSGPVSVVLEDISNEEEMQIKDYIAKQVEQVLKTIVSSSVRSMCEDEHNPAIPVKIKSDSPVDVTVSNSDIVDYFAMHSAMLPGSGL